MYEFLDDLFRSKKTLVVKNAYNDDPTKGHDFETTTDTFLAMRSLTDGTGKNFIILENPSIESVDEIDGRADGIEKNEHYVDHPMFNWVDLLDLAREIQQPK